MNGKAIEVAGSSWLVQKQWKCPGF